jgi:hypothetical protein
MPNASTAPRTVLGTVLGFGVLAATLAGCAKDIKPTGPVLTPFERGRDFATATMAPARYSGNIPPLTKVPVLPFMGFGLNYDVDVVLGLKSDDFDMIEVARTQSADGPLWVVVETEADTKSQLVLSAAEDMNTWMPELPLDRKTTQLVVQDKTTTDGLDLSVKYDNSDNLPVEMTLQGQPAEKRAKKRNGNPMGHSENELLTAIDVSSAESLFLADVRIDDDRVRARKMGGITPFQLTTTKAVGGIATGEYFQTPVAEYGFAAAGKKPAIAEWVPAPPPPPEPVIPGPMNLPPEEIVLLPMDEWVAIEDEVRATMLDAQETKVDNCITAGKAVNPDYAGVVAVDMYVSGGKTYQVTVDPMSTGAELVMQCAQTTASEWTFEAAEGEDEPVEGSIRVMIGSLPDDHEVRNELEQAWLDMKAEMMPEDGMDEGDDIPEGEAIPEGEEIPEDLDLLGDDPDAAPMEDEAPSMVTPIYTFDSVHTMPDGQKIAQRWDIERRGGQVWVSQSSDHRTLAYEFLVKGEDSTLELRSITVTPWGQSVPTTAITFSPALPDLRRQFNGKVTSKFVIDIAGQESYTTGTAVSSFGDSGVKVELTPTAPSWAVDRPIVSTVNFRDGMPYVSTRRKE